MYAVVDLQGHQYIVSEGAEIVVDNLGVAQSEKFVADKVLVAFSQDGKDVKNRYARLKGFRPLQTVLTVKKINA